MKAHLIIGGLLLVLLSLALAQDNPKRIEPIPPITPIPEEGKKAVKPELKLPVEVTPTPESQPTPERSQLQPISPTDVIGEEKKVLDKPVFGPIPSVSGVKESVPEYKPWMLNPASQISSLEESMPQYAPVGLNPVGTVQPVDGMSYQVREFKDFSGGWNISTYKTKLAPNEAVDLENALWNPGKELYMRPGYSEHSTLPEVLNFLYRYYQQDGDKWTMGGSDTALYFWHEDSIGYDSSGWTYLTGTEGISGRWDGTTFEDLFVGTHEGIEPIAWNGSTFVEMGIPEDSLQVLSCDGLTGWGYPADTTVCAPCTLVLCFSEGETGWDVNEWVDYICAYRLMDGTIRYDLITSNTDHVLRMRASNESGMFLTGTYAWIYSWFETDTVWREGTIGGVATCEEDLVYIYDSTFYWDSTFAYGEYIVEIIEGEGAGEAAWMIDFLPAWMSCAWDTNAFLFPAYNQHCFEAGSKYKIYKRGFWTGSKFVENFDGRLWLGWTGLGEEQEKNRLVFSEPEDLGNWPPENNIYIGSVDGDFITGMAKFEGQYMDVPRSELVVGKNNSLYKITPASEGYNVWSIASGVGFASNSAISSVEGKFLLFPDQHGVWLYDKTNLVSISAKIDPIFKEWNIAELERTSAIYNPDRHYYLSVPGEYLLEDFEDSTEWTLYGGDSFNIDSTNVRHGGQALRVNSVSGGAISIKKAVSWNLSGIENFIFWVYVHDDLTKNDYVAVYLTSGDDTFSQRFVATVSGSMMKKGWNRFAVSKDDFGVTGDESWSNTMTFVRFRGRAEDDSTASFTFDDFRVNYSAPKAKAIICFDDGQVSVYEEGKPIMDNYGFRGTAFIVTNFPQAQDPSKMSISQLTELRDAGWDISNHSKSHPDLTTISADSMSAEINGAYDWLVDNGFEASAKFFAYPYGVYTDFDNPDDAIIDSVKRNHKLSRATHLSNFQTFFQLDDDNIDMVIKCNGVDSTLNYGNWYAGATTWIDRTIQHHGLLIMLFHDIVDSNIVVLQKICEYLREKDSEIDVITFGDLYEGIADWEKGYNTLAFNVDFGCWSKESFRASAYCYQHSITDDVKILFADPEETKVYNYATQADDIDESVIFTYQSPYVRFSEWPSFNYQMRFATLEAYLDIGTIYLDWYKDYGDLSYQDSITCWDDCREEMALPDTLRGRNISMKLTTGSGVDDFTLSRFWWEGVLEPNRR